MEIVFAKFVTKGKTRGKFRVVSDDYQNRLLLLMKIDEQRSNHIGCFAVKVPGWFVTQEQSWFHDECARQGHTLFLATRKFRGPMCQSIAQADFMQQRPCLFHMMIVG
jgi:hypothetical protein